MNNIFFTYLFLLSTIVVNAQSIKTVKLDYSAFIQIVKTQHPIAYQSSLKLKEGDAYVLKAKGGFDPNLTGNANQKYFDGKQYYSYLNGALKIPTWFGIEAYAGYNLNNGERLNPEAYTYSTGLWNAGLSINLGKGLLMDKRRADLKQAKITRESSALEQKIILNKLIYDASFAYLSWQKAYDKLQLYNRSIENLMDRMNNLKQSVLLGDKPAIDTLKVNIQLQERQLKREQVSLALKNKREQLSTFMWSEGIVPLDITEEAQPNFDAEIPLLNAVDEESVVASHPEILMLQNNISISNIENRLKKESLKPALQLKYNALASDFGNGVLTDYSLNNYTWGASFSYPIFTRKARGNIRLSNLKIEQKELKLASKKEALKYKIVASNNSVNSYGEQIRIQANSVTLYKELFKAEQTMFEIGESSMFLLNTRDQNVINAELKMIDLRFAHYLSFIDYNYIIYNL